VRFALKSTRLALRNSTTRIPFRYGSACMTCCPQAVMEAVLECDGGRVQAGYGGDCLPPGWFDKTPGRSYAQQIGDMLAAAASAERIFSEEAARPTPFFDAWQAAYQRQADAAVQHGWQPLVASFGLSFVERAVMDALARAAGMSFAQAVRTNLYSIRPEEVHASLSGLLPADWLAAGPRSAIHVRHTIGLSDPLTAGDIPPSERVSDGFPQALEDYIQQNGTRYFKLKLANRLEHDIERLRQFASVLERHLGSEYRLTLDGNELYGQAEDFEALVDGVQSHATLRTLWKNTLVIEQPLARSIALEPRHTAGLRAICRAKPVIIDESDATIDSYAQAIELGYRGVSSKSCKGPIKSILNAGLTWLANDRGRRGDFLMTGEDLCTVGIVPVQADLCLAATLGLEHVERNGHHYHRGLSYLPAGQQQAALAAHGDLYEVRGDVVAPAVRAGRFEIGSLQCPGFGFAVVPDINAMTPAEDWRFDSLGLSD
jgi:hypothetical protein